MYTAYVLKSEDGRLYKGVTSNISRRLYEHRSGKTKTTRSMNNIELAYKEEFDTFDKARKRELYFKSAAGRRFLKNKLGA